MTGTTDWSEVRKGWVVQDKNGGRWTVIAVAGPVITISAPGRKEHTAERHGPVTVVSRPAPQDDPEVAHAVAVGTVVTRLGGVVVSKQSKDRTKGHSCPLEYDDPSALLAHLGIFHNTTSSDPSLRGLRAEHAKLHHPSAKADEFYEHHVHTPDFEAL